MYEFIQRRSDWKKIEKTVDKTMYSLSFKEDCIISWEFIAARVMAIRVSTGEDPEVRTPMLYIWLYTGTVNRLDIKCIKVNVQPPPVMWRFNLCRSISTQLRYFMLRILLVKCSKPLCLIYKIVGIHTGPLALAGRQLKIKIRNSHLYSKSQPPLPPNIFFQSSMQKTCVGPWLQLKIFFTQCSSY